MSRWLKRFQNDLHHGTVMETQGKMASAWPWTPTSSNRFLSLHSEKSHFAIRTLLPKITSSGILPAEVHRAAGQRECPQACERSAFWTQSAQIFGNPRLRPTLHFRLRPTLHISPGTSLSLLQVCPAWGVTGGAGGTWSCGHWVLPSIPPC